MALFAKLQFGNNLIGIYNRSYNLVRFRSCTNRKFNRFCLESDPECRYIEMTLIVPDRNDRTLHEWYICNSIMSGCIQVDLSHLVDDGLTLTRNIYFDDAICFSMSEDYNIQIAQRRTITLRISADKVKVEDVTFNQHIQL